jgi:hypothetical protein
MARVTSAAFSAFADRVSTERSRELHHVYDWGLLGVPSGRLFRLIMTGRGNERILSYDFKASSQPVPKGMSTSTDVPDTRGRFHIFYWKAPILEQGTAQFTIYPAPDKGILVWMDPKTRKMMFSKKPVRTNTLGETNNKFSELWSNFWLNFAQEIVITDIVNPTDETLSSGISKVYAGISKPTNAKLRFSMTPRKNHKSSIQRLEASLASGYLRAARQREAIAGGNSIEYDSD